MKLPIYLDHQATTPMDPAVLEAMLPFLKEEFGNAASRSHAFGLRAEEAVKEARAQVARLINAASPDEIVFTSGATESDNLALRGIAEMYRDRGNHIVTSAIEHRAVRDTCKFLETQGFRVTYLPAGRDGIVDPSEVEKALTKQTILISIMFVNNEIGTVQSIAEIGKIASERNIFFHTDAAQAAGKVPMDVQGMNIHLASLSAHKMYGPKGVGALYVRKASPRVRVAPLLYGGGHEGGIRSGTPNVPGIVGFGAACALSEELLLEEGARVLKLRERLREGLQRELDHVHVNGNLERRVPGNLNMSFDFVEGETLLKETAKEIAVSSGSACSSATLEPSYVLKALGVGEAREHTSIRFGLGRFNTEQEIDFTVKKVAAVVKRLRAETPLYDLHKQGK